MCKFCRHLLGKRLQKFMRNAPCGAGSHVKHSPGEARGARGEEGGKRGRKGVKREEKGKKRGEEGEIGT
jgi:hypothetical protein